MNAHWLRYGRIAGLLGAITAAACSTPPGPRPGVVLDAIQREIAVAAATQPSAPPPAAVESSLLPPLTLDGGRGSSGEARFDIAVHGAPAEQVFMAIVNGTPYSMLLPPDLSGSVTLNLKNVTVRETLATRL